VATYAMLRAKEKERRSSIIYRSEEREWQAYIQRKDHAMAPMAFVVCQLIVPTWPMALVRIPAILRSHLWRSRICLGQECHAAVNGGGEAEFFT
jgi:hypothetical protein